MAIDPNLCDATPGDPQRPSRPAKSGAGKDGAPTNLPPSKPLQIFLLAALLITGAAYVVGEWTELATEQNLAHHPTKLRRLVAAQNEFLTETALGHEAEAKKQYTEAVGHFRHALLGQVNTEGRLNLGNALLKTGNPAMAFSQFQEALRLDPGQEAIYAGWGEALLSQSNIDAAEQICQDGLRRNTNFARVHYLYARILGQKEQAALAASSAAGAALFAHDAARHYADAERLGLTDPDFERDYGTLLNKQAEYAQAEARLAQAVRQQPGSGAAQFQLALAQDRQGKYADAISHYEATLAALPDDPATLNNLALIYASSSDRAVRSPKMAVSLATRACDATNNKNARYMDTLARAYAADGDFFQAVVWEDKAVQCATQSTDHDLLRELQPRFSLFVQHKNE
jgi:tetratricopeptide (TPR) repeat protein